MRKSKKLTHMLVERTFPNGHQKQKKMILCLGTKIDHIIKKWGEYKSFIRSHNWNWKRRSIKQCCLLALNKIEHMSRAVNVLEQISSIFSKYSWNYPIYPVLEISCKYSGKYYSLSLGVILIDFLSYHLDMINAAFEKHQTNKHHLCH